MTKSHQTVQSARQETQVTGDEQAAGNSHSEGLVSVSLSMHKYRIVHIAGVIVESDQQLADPLFRVCDPLCLIIH